MCFLVSRAQTELQRFDNEHPHPGLWSKQQWQMQRARRLQALGQCKQAYEKAIQATQPEAQAGYTRHAIETGVELERLSQAMLTRYPVPEDLVAKRHASWDDALGSGVPLPHRPRV